MDRSEEMISAGEITVVAGAEVAAATVVLEVMVVPATTVDRAAMVAPEVMVVPVVMVDRAAMVAAVQDGKEAIAETIIIMK